MCVLLTNPEQKGALYMPLQGDTLWLNLNRMAGLFERDKSIVLRYLENVFKTDELDRRRPELK